MVGSKIHRLVLSGANIFDSDPWAISFGRIQSQKIKSKAKSLFYLRAGKFSGGKKIKLFTTASFIDETTTGLFENISSGHNASGSFLMIGSQSLNNADKYVNKGTVRQKTTYFSGEVSYINFWSKSQKMNEFLAYAKNPNSVGSEFPLINYNYNQLETGSFERLRVNTFGKQYTTSSNDLGQIKLFDFTQNNLHLQGQGFEKNKTVLTPCYTIYEILSPHFDLNTSREKVRIRSVIDEKIRQYHDHASIGPRYEVRRSEEVFDDNRFSIDMSVMKGLNENILRIYSDFKPFDNALGKPTLMFSENYHDIVAYRRMYFNNLLEKINLQTYASLFKWIDNTYTEIVASLIPRNTNFLGINFVYESHVLERNRFKYLFDSMYLKNCAKPEDPRRNRPDRVAGSTGDYNGTSTIISIRADSSESASAADRKTDTCTVDEKTTRDETLTSRDRIDRTAADDTLTTFTDTRQRVELGRISEEIISTIRVNTGDSVSAFREPTKKLHIPVTIVKEFLTDLVTRSLPDENIPGAIDASVPVESTEIINKFLPRLGISAEILKLLEDEQLDRESVREIYDYFARASDLFEEDPNNTINDLAITETGGAKKSTSALTWSPRNPYDDLVENGALETGKTVSEIFDAGSLESLAGKTLELFERLGSTATGESNNENQTDDNDDDNQDDDNGGDDDNNALDNHWGNNGSDGDNTDYGNT